MQDLSRIRFVTEHYTVLQGLHTVPLGIWFFISAASDAGWLPWWQIWRPISHGLSLVLVIALYRWIGRYYQRAFGLVYHPAQEQAEKRKGVAMMVIIIAALLADWRLQWPVSLLALALGGFFMAYYLSQSGRYRHYHLLVTALFIGLGFLPLVLGTTTETASGDPAAWLSNYCWEAA